MTSKLTKKQKEVQKNYDSNRSYKIEEATSLIKEITYTKFDASIDIAVQLGVDPKKPDQMIRGTLMLPHGTGKDTTILALVPPDKEQEAKSQGAQYVGLEEYIEKIKNGWLDFDVIVTIPSVMIKLGPLAKILGPRGLMPNPKTDTVTQNLGATIKEFKAGKINFKVDRSGIIHSSIAKVSFEEHKIGENIKFFCNNLIKLKPSSSKGTYIKKIHISSTMSPSILIDYES